MLQKDSHQGGQLRGRPPAFDADAVIDGAVDLFWRKGFGATSLQDIEARLDIRPSTLYNSFGGKNGLYESAVDRYLSGADDYLFKPALEGEAGLDDLVKLYDRLTRNVSSPKSPDGCLVVNAMVTGEHGGAVERYSALLRSTIDRVLGRAIDLGEIEPAAVVGIGAACFASVLGVNVASKSGATKAEIREMFRGFTHTVEAWRNAPAEIG